MNSVKLHQILEHLNKTKCKFSILNRIHLEITGINNPKDAIATQMIFIGEERQDYEAIVSSTNSTFIIMSNDHKNDPILNTFTSKCLLFVDHPRYYFSIIYNAFFYEKKVATIATNSKISKKAIIGKNVSIGEYVVIEDDCIIGDDSFIDSHVTIKSKTTLGKSVRIYAGAVIGSDGFGFIKKDSSVVNFPHVAGVEICEGAEIGANTVIDKGALRNTFIGNHTKIDNLCHIAHNVHIGKNCFIIANSMIGGSTNIGDNTWIAPSSCLRDGLTIGTNVTIGMGSVVIKNIPDSETWAGNPACRMDELKRRIKKLSGS
jgi:UDP-3-O-[3-hydroxymyristoyl] glucosamine N-acyltransferase